MSTQDILAELPRLSAEDQELIAKVLHDLKAEKQTPSAASGPRTAGLHEGAWIIADDFDDPLPDEFWFGKDT